MTPQIGDGVSFITGSGWEVEGHVGTVVALGSRDVTVRYRWSGGEHVRLVRYNEICEPIHWSGRNSPLDYASQIEEAIARCRREKL